MCRSLCRPVSVGEGSATLGARARTTLAGVLALGAVVAVLRGCRRSRFYFVGAAVSFAAVLGSRRSLRSAGGHRIGGCVAVMLLVLCLRLCWLCPHPRAHNKQTSNNKTTLSQQQARQQRQQQHQLSGWGGSARRMVGKRHDSPAPAAAAENRVGSGGGPSAEATAGERRSVSLGMRPRGVARR